MGYEICEILFYVEKKKKKRKKERDIKYNKKDTLIPIFNGGKGEVGNDY